MTSRRSYAHFISLHIFFLSGFSFGGRFGSVRFGSALVSHCLRFGGTDDLRFELYPVSTYTLSYAPLISLHVGDPTRLLYHHVSLTLFHASLNISLTIFGDDSPVHLQPESKSIFSIPRYYTHIYIGTPPGDTTRPAERVYHIKHILATAAHLIPHLLFHFRFR